MYSIDRFCKERVRADQPESLLREAKEIGLFGISIPEKYGGSGMCIAECSKIVAELAYWDCSFAVSIGLHNGLGSRGLIRFGSEKLKSRFLPEMASGDRIAAFSATESEAGSHIANVQTKLVPDEQASSRYRLDGSKVFVTNGGIAGLYTVLASNGNHKGLSLVVVPRESAGVVVGEEEKKLGLKGSSTTSLLFDHVSVPEQNILGQPGEGLHYLEDVLSWGRALLASGCLGAGRKALDLATKHAQGRIQFGRPIASFALVQEKLKRMQVLLATMEWVIERLGGIPESELPLESAIAKIVCSEGAFQIIDDALQIHGGSGCMEEVGVARLYRDIRVARIFEGTNEMLRLFVAMHLMDRLSKGKGLFASVPAQKNQRIQQELEAAKKFGSLRWLQDQILQRDTADACMQIYLER